MTGSDVWGGWVPPVVDTRTPSVARMYDYYLGGKDNYEADREAAEQVAQALPDVQKLAWENRAFLGRATRFLIDQGIDQFVDVGTGLPTQGHVHQVTAAHCLDARVVYADNDPIVLSHARALIPPGARVRVVDGDLRDPASILDDPATRNLIDFSRPVGVLLVAMPHFATEADDPAGIVHAFTERLTAGSFVVLSHATCDGPPLDAVAQVETVYSEASAPIVFRTRAQITGLFAGLELVAPELRYVPRWRPDPKKAPRRGSRLLLGGVGHKLPATP